MRISNRILYYHSPEKGPLWVCVYHLVHLCECCYLSLKVESLCLVFLQSGEICLSWCVTFQESHDVLAKCDTNFDISIWWIRASLMDKSYRRNILLNVTYIILLLCKQSTFQYQIYNRGRYRISRKRGRGLTLVMDISCLDIFVTRHITRCTDKMSADKILGGQNASQNCKGGQNAGHFKGQGGQNANLI